METMGVSSGDGQRGGTTGLRCSQCGTGNKLDLGSEE